LYHFGYPSMHNYVVESEGNENEEAQLARPKT
jgi:hypothetical protein